MAQIPIFQVDGKFDYAHAVAVLRAQGRSIPEIEALFKRDVKLRQLDSALTLSSFATAAEIKQIRALTKQQRELAWLTLPAEKYASQAVPDDAALKTYYDAHKSEYMTPETVDLHYVEISLVAAGRESERRRRAAEGLLRRAEGKDSGALRSARAATGQPYSVAGREPERRRGGQGQGGRDLQACPGRRGFLEVGQGILAGSGIRAAGR